MKRVLFLSLGCAVWACAQEAAVSQDDEAAVAEQRRAKMQELRAEMLRRNGPMVSPAQKGPSILMLDLQSAVEHGIVTNVVDNLGKVTRLPFKVVRREAEEGMMGDPVALARGVLEPEDVGAVIVVVERKGWPAILSAPEENWVVVNVEGLREDADGERFERRVQQELWRAACFALGAADSKVEKCVMNVVLKPGDLDGLNVAPYPEYLGKMMQRGRSLGIESRRITTYRKAVEEGWAEEPKDEIERAIWEDVKNPKAEEEGAKEEGE